MSAEALELISTSGSLLRTTALLLSTGAAAGAASLLIPQVLDRLMPPPNQDRLADFLLFDRMISPAIIKMSDGRYAMMIKIRGAELTFSTEEKHEDLYQRRKHMLDDLQKYGIDQVNLFQSKERDPIRQEATHKNPMLRGVAEAWNANFKHTYRLTHVMMLICRGGSDEDAIERMDNAARFVCDSLKSYNCSVMREGPDHSPEDGPLAALAAVISPVTRPKPTGLDWQDRVSDLLTADTVSFREEAKGIISFSNGVTKKYAVVIGIRDCGEKSMESVMRDVLSIDAEMTVYHGIQPLQSAKETLSLNREKRAAPVMNLSVTAAAEYDEVLAMVEGQQSGNKASTLMYSMHIIVYAESVKDCTRAESEINSILSRTGGTPVRERKIAQAVWFSQFQYDRFWPRMYRMLSSNIAANLYLHRINEGLKKSDWLNEPLTYFRSMYGAAYSFQLHSTEHREAPAHAVMIGPTGQGKTTFMSFIAGQAMRLPNLRVFLFDRHEGMRVFTTCANGKYVTFDGDTASANMNPLHLPDRIENRRFLIRFLKHLADVDSPADEQEIARAIEIVYDGNLPMKNRKLKDIYTGAFSAHGNVRANMIRWIDESAYGAYFNADSDTLDLRSNRLVGFDMTHILKEDGKIAGPVMDYFTHRLRMLADETGDPSLIFVDETEPMLANPKFAKDFVQVGLQEGRKKRQAYILAFQRAGAIKAAGISELIRTQCQTAYFFRNPTALASDYDEFDLNASELDFILGREFQNFPYAVLVKKFSTGESAVLDINLASIGKYFNAYQSGITNLRILRHMQEKHGDDFLEPYLNASR
ncbi:VirB4 family type IV secretion system protein [Microvirga tunisiensis]|uniref:CagE TrbE VirB component of type IV transporter system central domain-containing protein n=1 Tax=Microvirga tunisiensis TaxID=2108360 RepID=A0A5N7MLJ6_9HYPH|nr:VirB4 family type IV secretion system protein [Microvirga tunisiensis]MPR09533.1 hypothetical protein [Microvirga tunisiensis]MPR27753.1 hypothetical protein [Microvirga tunisiensis]